MESKELFIQHGAIKHIKMFEYEDYIYIETLVIRDEHRNKGNGTYILKEIIDYARKQNKTLFGYASSELGGDLEKLKSWYRRLGFQEEQGILQSGYRYNVRIN